MNIGATGTKQRLEELNLVLSSVECSFTALENTKNIGNQHFDVFFDLNFDEHQESIADFDGLSSHTILFLNSVLIQLDALNTKHIQNIVGINALPGFLSRTSLECCALNPDAKTDLILKLGWKNANWIQSRVGMVAPRVLFMIINEAFFTLEEGTANKQDIDKGMKLGTAYPSGPFEWCEKIGIKTVYETLLALKNDTGDERYKICNSLKTEYLRHKNNVAS